MENSRSFDPETILKGIEAGIQHLHSLGLIHGDIKPQNILMRGDTPVIADFDSWHREGSALDGPKGGTRFWEKEGAEFALPENDFFSLARIREWLILEKAKLNGWDLQESEGPDNLRLCLSKHVC